MKPSLRAIAYDSLFQILDNFVFRILVLLIALPVLLTFAVGFREEGIVFLFGLETWSYDRILQLFGGGAGGVGGIEDPHEWVIEAVIDLVFNKIAGNFGVIFCVVATAFFVPQMLEKGSADVLFHKPLSRFRLLLSRYFAGLFLVAVLAVCLVGGMVLGLFVVSGYDATSMLWAIPTLVWMFAIVHAVSVTTGVLTRSTVASILITVLFFVGNGLVHLIWRTFTPPPGVEAEETTGFIAVLDGVVQAGHLILPKTSDAEAVAAKLRARRPAFEHADSGFQLESLPPGWGPADTALELGGVDSEAAYGELLFAARGEDGAELSLWVRPKRKLERERGRPKTESKSDTTSLLVEALAPSGDVQDLEVIELEHQEEHRLGEPVVRNRGVHLRGTHRDGRQLEVVLLRSAREVLTLLIAGGPGEPYPAAFLELMKACSFQPPQQTEYHEHLTWDGPLGYNLIYSFGSTLAFLLLTLFLGAWRLSRIDY